MLESDSLEPTESREKPGRERQPQNRICVAVRLRIIVIKIKIKEQCFSRRLPDVIPNGRDCHTCDVYREGH